MQAESKWLKCGSIVRLNAEIEYNVSTINVLIIKIQIVGRFLERFQSDITIMIVIKNCHSQVDSDLNPNSRVDCDFCQHLVNGII